MADTVATMSHMTSRITIGCASGIHSLASLYTAFRNVLWVVPLTTGSAAGGTAVAGAALGGPHSSQCAGAFPDWLARSLIGFGFV